MTRPPNLLDLQESVKDKQAFKTLDDYFLLAHTYLDLLSELNPTRIISPNDRRYIFYQYGEDYAHKITRPLNSTLYIEDPHQFKQAFERFAAFIDDLHTYKSDLANQEAAGHYLKTNELNQVIYTCQQSIGAIGDSFENPNQSRKRIGQLFEQLIRLLMRRIGFSCESRTISVPIPNSPEHSMSYELDMVFAKEGAIITAENSLIDPREVVGSIKTTSKDRIDKIFLDKFLLSQLIGRNVKVVAIFLHEVQRARRANSIFGINSTFKTNHFLGYTIALNRLDGVYYVDPRPDMVTNDRLREEIRNFQQFLVSDVWNLC